jgi:hypothetical protein
MHDSAAAQSSAMRTKFLIGFLSSLDRHAA